MTPDLPQAPALGNTPASAQVRLADAIADAPPPVVRTGAAPAAQHKPSAAKQPCQDGCECPHGPCTCETCPVKQPAKPKPSTVGRFDGTFYYLKDGTGQEWYGGDWAVLWAFVWRLDHPAPTASAQPTVRSTVSQGAVYGSSCANGSCTAPTRTGIFRWPR